jgi:hypothetical protein
MAAGRLSDISSNNFRRDKKIVDGPLLLNYDQPDGFMFKNGVVPGFKPKLWG